MKVEIIQTTGPDKIFRLCALEEIPLGLGRAFILRGPPTRAVALFRTREGNVFATDNSCPHKGGPLSEGMLAGDCVVCPLHGFRFDFHGGACDQPNVRPVKTYPIELREGQVFIHLP